MANSLLNGLFRVLRDAATRSLRRPQDAPSGGPRTRARFKQNESPQERRREEPSGDYPGDFTQMPEISYAPHLDGRPDPGEIVWTWVPYEEDHSRGKDRPVLLIGHDGPWLLGLQITSQDHDRDEEQEARAGRYWLDIGAGDWDSQRRPSEVRVNRIIRIDPDTVRRVGAILDESTFRTVGREVGNHY
ncbi:type II toxin-antitoxin system PemK/MazF family toxin [Tessaracoccus sp. Y36]